MSHIEISGHITTWEAFKYILKFHIVIFRNICKGIDRIVCSHPWICIMLTMAISFLICFMQISKARAERDNYNKKNVQLSEKIASYEAAFGKKQ